VVDATIDYSGFSAVVLNGSSGGGVFAVVATPAGTSVTLNGGPVAYEFVLGYPMSGIQGPLSLHGHSGQDVALFNDSTDAIGRTFTLTSNQLATSGIAPISFDGLVEVVLYSGAASNAYNVQSVAPGVFVNIVAGAGDAIVVGSQAPNLGGTLANIMGPVRVLSYSPDDPVSLVLDDSGNADLTPKNVRLTPPDSPIDYGNHIEGFAPSTVYWNLGANASVSLRGGAANESFALPSTSFASAISIDGGGGVNTLDYSAALNLSIPGLVAWYPGEGDAKDVTGSHNGTAVGGVQFAPGMVGRAFSFSGTGNEYVQVPNSPDLEPTNVSVEAWVNSSTDPVRNAYILSKGANGTVAASYALYTGFNAGLLFYISDGTNFIESPDAGTGVWDGNWHHVVGTYDGASVRLFVDGMEVGNGTATNLKIAYGLPTTNDLFLGTYFGGGDRSLPFSGLIDEPSIYNRALSAAEVGTLFGAGSEGKSALTQGVVVNLQLGTATNLRGGIANIQNVIGSPGNDILVGNGGNVLSGGLGRDLLIAGGTASMLVAGNGGAILIGGTTNYDTNQAALLAIEAEWVRTDESYDTRVTNLTTGNGVPLLDSSTVHSNGGGNTLTGGDGLDLFFASAASELVNWDNAKEKFIVIS
jgi:hypothetical protein